MEVHYHSRSRPAGRPALGPLSSLLWWQRMRAARAIWRAVARPQAPGGLAAGHVDPRDRRGNDRAGPAPPVERPSGETRRLQTPPWLVWDHQDVPLRAVWVVQGPVVRQTTAPSSAHGGDHPPRPRSRRRRACHDQHPHGTTLERKSDGGADALERAQAHRFQVRGGGSVRGTLRPGDSTPNRSSSGPKCLSPTWVMLSGRSTAVRTHAVSPS